MRREDAGVAGLFACFDGLGVEENLDCAACNAKMLKTALEARQRRVVVKSRTLQSASQAFYSVMHQFSELEPGFVAWDFVQERCKTMARREIAPFKTEHTDMAPKCGRICGVLEEVDEDRLKYCEETCK